MLADGFDFVLTNRFQSDPIERKYGQYRQMSGGSFLVSLKNITLSEIILKIKSLVKEGIKIDKTVKLTGLYDLEVQEMLGKFEQSVLNASVPIKLSDSSKEVSDYSAGYISVQMQDNVCDTCCDLLALETNLNKSSSKYVSTLSRVGLTNASTELCNYVQLSLTYLDASCAIIRNSNVPARIPEEEILKKICRPSLFCSKRQIGNAARVDRILTYVFFNNQRKRVTESVVNDRDVAFKRRKREKWIMQAPLVVWVLHKRTYHFFV